MWCSAGRGDGRDAAAGKAAGKAVVEAVWVARLARAGEGGSISGRWFMVREPRKRDKSVHTAVVHDGGREKVRFDGFTEYMNNTIVFRAPFECVRWRLSNYCCYSSNKRLRASEVLTSS